MVLALPPSTETVALHPASHATDRITVDGMGLVKPDVLGLRRAGDHLHRHPSRPFLVEAAIGSAGLAESEHGVSLGQSG